MSPPAPGEPITVVTDWRPERRLAGNSDKLVLYLGSGRDYVVLEHEGLTWCRGWAEADGAAIVAACAILQGWPG